MESSYLSYDTVVLNGVQFKTERSHVKNARINLAGVMMPWANDQGAQQYMYGVLVDVIEHRLCDGVPPAVVFEVRWYTHVRNLHNGMMPIVKYDPRDSWHTGGAQFDLASSFYPQHVAFNPIESRKWNMLGELCVLYRRA